MRALIKMFRKLEMTGRFSIPKKNFITNVKRYMTGPCTQYTSPLYNIPCSKKSKQRYHLVLNADRKVLSGI